MRAFAYAAFYGIYGPLFAVLVLVVTALMSGLGERADALDLLLGLPALVSISFGMYFFALVFGILPAATTGLVYWWLSGLPFVARLPSLTRVVLMSLVGGSVVALFILCFGGAPSEVFSEDALLLFVIPGMIAASLCTFLVNRQTRRMPPS